MNDKPVGPRRSPGIEQDDRDVARPAVEMAEQRGRPEERIERARAADQGQRAIDVSGWRSAYSQMMWLQSAAMPSGPSIKRRELGLQVVEAASPFETRRRALHLDDATRPSPLPVPARDRAAASGG